MPLNKGFIEVQIHIWNIKHWKPFHHSDMMSDIKELWEETFTSAHDLHRGSQCNMDSIAELMAMGIYGRESLHPSRSSSKEQARTRSRYKLQSPIPSSLLLPASQHLLEPLQCSKYCHKLWTSHHNMRHCRFMPQK